MFGLHRSSYKYWHSRPKVLSPEKVKLGSLVREAHAASNGSAGTRSITEIVTAKGTTLSRYRASKFMKQLGFVSCQLPKHAYKNVDREHFEIPNYQVHQFQVTEPNQVWCGDVTYIWTSTRWAYLAVVIDFLLEKRLVGQCRYRWHLNQGGSLKDSYFIANKAANIRVENTLNCFGATK